MLEFPVIILMIIQQNYFQISVSSQLSKFQQNCFFHDERRRYVIKFFFSKLSYISNIFFLILLIFTKHAICFPHVNINDRITQVARMRIAFHELQN